MAGDFCVMSMMNFEQIWSEFKWVIDEMKDGMCFFEGYIPSIGQEDLGKKLRKLIGASITCTFMDSVWSNDTTESDWEKEHTPSEYIEFFTSDKILILHLNYEKKTDDIVINLKLIFEKENGLLKTLEIICYRESILGSNNPEKAVEIVINELRYLNQLFKGDSLFIGPDTLNYPKNKNENLKEWLRIE